MYYEGIADDLPIEAIVARNMGDADWEDLCVDYGLADGCSRANPNIEERAFSAHREAEPVTVKAAVTRKRFTTR